MKDEIEFLRGLAMCDDKEQMMRYIQENAPKPPSRADRIRAMTDEELAKLLYDPDSLSEKYCKNLPECGELLDTDTGIPEEKCIGCMLQWLRQPAEGGCDG